MDYVIKQSQIVTTQDIGTSRFHEYRFPFTNASLGVSEIDGRYPETGYDVDEAIEQSWYVESGTASVRIDDQEYRIEHGDMVHIPPGRKYWIKGDGLRLIVASSPEWFESQHKHVDE